MVCIIGKKESGKTITAVALAAESGRLYLADADVVVVEGFKRTDVRDFQAQVPVFDIDDPALPANLADR